MCVRACVRVFNCVSCSRDKENVRARREFYRERERERERGLAGKIFFVFFISFLSCLVLCLVFVFENLPLKEGGKEKKTELFHTKKRKAARGRSFRTKRKKNNPLPVVKSVKASVRSPLNDLAHREPQQHGSSCRRNLHLRAS